MQRNATTHKPGTVDIPPPIRQPLSKDSDGVPVAGSGSSLMCACHEQHVLDHTWRLCACCRYRYLLDQPHGADWRLLSPTDKKAIRAFNKANVGGFVRVNAAPKRPVSAANNKARAARRAARAAQEAAPSTTTEVAA